MVGAVLTQSTSWTNVEKAVDSLKAADALSPEAIRRLSHEELATIIYSAGFHNSKARKLKAMADYLGDRFDDDLDAMRRVDPADLRAELLGVHGIGNETADSILLYALEMPSFVVDAYTRRLLSPGSGVVPGARHLRGRTSGCSRTASNAIRRPSTSTTR